MSLPTPRHFLAFSVSVLTLCLFLSRSASAKTLALHNWGRTQWFYPPRPMTDHHDPCAKKYGQVYEERDVHHSKMKICHGLQIKSSDCYCMRQLHIDEAFRLHCGTCDVALEHQEHLPNVKLWDLVSGQDMDKGDSEHSEAIDMGMVENLKEKEEGEEDGIGNHGGMYANVNVSIESDQDQPDNELDSSDSSYGKPLVGNQDVVVIGEDGMVDIHAIGDSDEGMTKEDIEVVNYDHGHMDYDSGEYGDYGQEEEDNEEEEEEEEESANAEENGDTEGEEEKTSGNDDEEEEETANAEEEGDTEGEGEETRENDEEEEETDDKNENDKEAGNRHDEDEDEIDDEAAKYIGADNEDEDEEEVEDNFFEEDADFFHKANHEGREEEEEKEKDEGGGDTNGHGSEGENLPIEIDNDVGEEEKGEEEEYNPNYILFKSMAGYRNVPTF